MVSFLLLFLFGVRAHAQQSILAIPSSDVLDRGAVSLDFAALFKPNDEEELRRFSSFVPGFTVGLGKDVEVGFNVTGNLQPGTDAATLVPGIKWKFYERKKLSLFVGTNFYIPVMNRAYKAGLTSYIGASKSIGRSRFTVGGFISTRNVIAPNATRSGGLFGFEYTINKRIGLAADWINGRHSAGFFTSGLVYKLHPKVTTNFAYSVGNNYANRGNHFFLIDTSYTFD